MKIKFWQKEEPPVDTGFAPYEEIDAKRTSALGYFFLVLMVIFGVWQGNNFLNALQRNIDAPTANSNCLSVLESFTGSRSPYEYGYYYTYNTSSSCYFSERETQLSIDVLFQNVKPKLIQLEEASKIIQKIETAQREASYSREVYITEYQASLLEDIAGKNNTVFNQSTIQNNIVTQDEYLARLNSSLNEEKTRVEKLKREISSAVSPYIDTIQAARDQYSYELTVHQFIQFLVSLLFVVPLFVFVWKRYHQSKNRRSEYAIIWGGLVATVGLLLAEIILIFIYEILPRSILEIIFDFLAQFEFIWTILYWLGFILVPLFFGFLIYLIQKKFYNKKAVMMRALKNERCPGCSLKLHHDMNHCPVCGYTLKERCSDCGAMTMRGGGYCSTCGTILNKTD